LCKDDSSVQMYAVGTISTFSPGCWSLSTRRRETRLVCRCKISVAQDKRKIVMRSERRTVHLVGYCPGRTSGTMSPVAKAFMACQGGIMVPAMAADWLKVDNLKDNAFLVLGQSFHTSWPTSVDVSYTSARPEGQTCQPEHRSFRIRCDVYEIHAPLAVWNPHCL
jgi:hypothetical protein